MEIHLKEKEKSLFFSIFFNTFVGSEGDAQKSFWECSGLRK